MVLGFVSFTVSRFLHGVAESDQRATLLSVKGLVFNLGYAEHRHAIGRKFRGELTDHFGHIGLFRQIPLGIPGKAALWQKIHVVCVGGIKGVKQVFQIVKANGRYFVILSGLCEKDGSGKKNGER